MASMPKVQKVPLSEVPQNTDPEPQDDRPVVLVVDDEVLIADTVSLILMRNGFAAYAAYGSAAALKMMTEIEPELLLTDVAMPGMNGVELATEVKRVWPDCKVLLFSGHAGAETILRTQPRGKRPFELLSKPLHPAQLIVKVRDYLNFPAPGATAS